MKRLLLVAPLVFAACSHDASRNGSGGGESGIVDAAPLRTDWTPQQLEAACKEAEKTCDAKLAKIASLKDSERTFANTPEAIEQVTTDWSEVVGRAGFMKDIHPDEKVRAAATACEEEAGKYAARIASRKDLYLAVKAWQARGEQMEERALPATGGARMRGASIGPQDRRLVELMMRDFHRAGVDLSDEQREKLVALRSRLAELQTRFSSNLDEDTTSVEMSREELDGMPEAYVARLKKTSAGKYVVTTKYPDYFPFLENAKSTDARRKLEVAFMNRGAKDNLKLLDEAVALRDEAAHLLGYATHADYVTEVRMAKSARNVQQFEDKLEGRLRERLAVDRQKMSALKKADTGDATIHAWDWRYYLNQLRKRDYALDDEKIRAYFPADKVMSGMMDVYSRLLSVQFKRVEGAPVWADGVSLYEVRDGGRLLAKFYVDLFPRPGKYGHAAAFGVGPARQLPAGYQIPLTVLVVNFTPPAAGKIAHLTLDEVEVLVHEFGHVMHGSLTTAKYASISGTNVATDFVEAPSQMLENWVYQPEILKMISSGPNGEPMPADLIASIGRARKFDAGVRYSRQVFLGQFDLYIHTHGAKVDPDAAAKKLWTEIMSFPEDPQSHFAAGFGHMMSGYDAGYYGYLWSEVFAADMFTRFAKEGVLNPKTGREYRDIILAKGRSEDPDQLLREFLGREPNEDAFLRQIGIGKPSASN
ncbi:MAG: M3 family metallopeptidase [Myxococcales bacterium]